MREYLAAMTTEIACKEAELAANEAVLVVRVESCCQCFNDSPQEIEQSPTRILSVCSRLFLSKLVRPGGEVPTLASKCSVKRENKDVVSILQTYGSLRR